jgi:hypothetical protein
MYGGKKYIYYSFFAVFSGPASSGCMGLKLMDPGPKKSKKSEKDVLGIVQER